MRAIIEAVSILVKEILTVVFIPDNQPSKPPKEDKL